MAPCERYTLEECVNITGIDGNDAALLCGEKNRVPAEYVSTATVAIVIYLIANIYIQIAESSVLLSGSEIWGVGKPNEREGQKAITRAATWTCVIGAILYIVTTVVVGKLTDPLDNRTNSIVVGLSEIFAAIIFCMMSVNIPQWFGVYHSNKTTAISFTSGREIRFNLSWNLWKQLMSMYFFNLYFSCADFDLCILYGALIGIAVGIITVLIAMKARSPSYAMHKRKLAILVIVLFSIGSWWALWAGIWYIMKVWNPNEDDISDFAGFFLSLIWIGFMVVLHLVVRSWTGKKKALGHSMRFTSQLFDASNLGNLISSMKKCEGKDGEENCDGDEGNGDTKKASATEVATSPAAIAIPEGVDVGGDNDKKESEEDDRDDPLSDKEGQETIEHHVAFAEDSKESPDENTADNRYVGYEDAPSYWKLFMTKLVDTYPFFCGCCLKKKHDVKNISRKRLDYINEAREISKLRKFFLGLKRFIWYFFSIAFFLLTIVNIKATHEQCAAKNALEPTFKQLYPQDYNTGTMCAWDEPGPNATIKEFDSVQAVNDANYKVVHCGSCGACSNWNDLQLQYTSRRVLAGITKKCAQKSIFIKSNSSDDNDPVVQCNHLQVGFTMPCSKAWAWDEVHTKNHAIFTFIQANIANSFSDMEVTFQDITMATIDEALSGPTFVPWVGATRRRMDIKSDIQRPISQQCTAARENNWTEIFGDEFKPPVGGTYTIRSPRKPGEEIVVVGQDSL